GAGARLLQRLLRDARPLDQLHFFTRIKSVLHVAELIHRISNEYARAIAFTSIIAARSDNLEVKTVLSDIICYLHRSADLYQLLRPSLSGGPIELTEHLTRLCHSMANSFAMERADISLTLSTEEPLWLESATTWRVSLIIAELVNNA